jgi:inorganic triphosphatase YgiF
MVRQPIFGSRAEAAMAHSNSEIELKLEVAAPDIARLRRLLRRERRVTAPPQIRQLDSTYFDTPRHELRDAGLTLRLRCDGERMVQTIKLSDARGGFIDRGEWEREVRAKGNGPDLAAARDTPLKRLLTRKTRDALKPVFRTEVTRTSYRLDQDGSQVELALDEGRIQTARRSEPVSEVEIELKRGDPAALFALARELDRKAPIRLGVRSKSERGYALLDQRPPHAVKAGRLRLSPRTGTAQAFRAIAMSCLRQLIINEPAMLRGDAEALHQMRVALRRLRAALSLFSDMVADRQVEEIKSGLKWMTDELAPARDLEVFATEAVEPARQRRQGKSGTGELKVAVARREAAAVDHAKKAVASRRFRTHTLATAEWIEAGPWTARRDSGARKLRERPLERHAREELSRRHRQIAKKGRNLSELSAFQRHKLRIAVKKLRYAVDFFAGAFPGHKAKKRRTDLEGDLKELQNALGSINDVAVRDRLGAKLAGGRATGKSTAFAAGLVIGEQDARVDSLMADAATALRHLRKVTPFWT